MSPTAAPALAAARPGERPGPGLVRAFPDEGDRSGALPLEAAERLAAGPSALYAALAGALAGTLTRRLGLSPAAALALARDPAAVSAHAALDRLERVRLLAREGPRELSARRAPLPAPATWAELAAGISGSRALNQALLGLAGEALGLPDAAPPEEPAPRPARGAANLNFDSPSLPRRLRRKLSRLASRAAGRVPALGLAYAEPALLDAGLVGPGLLADLGAACAENPPPPDAALRRELLDGARAAEPEAAALLARWGWSPREAAAGAAAVARAAAELFPRARLEGAGKRLGEARRALTRFAPRPVLYGEIGGEAAAARLAAARELGMPVLGAQHSAHYGFVDAPCHIELELAHLDRFITWGWTRMPDHPLARRVEAVPLPSPWLSERRRAWRSSLPPPGAGPRDWDCLLMTERISPFPSALTTVRLGRLDALERLDAEHRDAVGALAARGLRVLHKPFNAASAQAQEGLLAELSRAWPGRYAVHDGLDKGLSPELVGRAKLLLWDEPGGGLFECLASGIPALCLWTRALVAESPRAREPFRALEEAGLVHRTPASLAESAAELARDPAGWLAAPRRREAVSAACRQLAWAQDDWARPWRAFLRSL